MSDSLAASSLAVPASSHPSAAAAASAGTQSESQSHHSSLRVRIPRSNPSSAPVSRRGSFASFSLPVPLSSSFLHQLFHLDSPFTLHRLPIYTLYLLLSTILLVFLNDFRLAVLPPSADLPILILYTILFTLICLEFLFLSFQCRSIYYRSIDCWIALLTAMSIIPYLPADSLNSFWSSSSPLSTSSAASSSSSSHSISTSDILHYLRFIPFLRLTNTKYFDASIFQTHFHFHPFTSSSSSSVAHSADHPHPHPHHHQAAAEAENPSHHPGHSHTGSGSIYPSLHGPNSPHITTKSSVAFQLNQSANRRLLVFAILFLSLIPVFKPYRPTEEFYESARFHFAMFDSIARNGSDAQIPRFQFHLSSLERNYPSLIALQIQSANPALTFSWTDPSVSLDSYRISEVRVLSFPHVSAILSVRSYQRLQAGLSILMSLLILLPFCIGSRLFSQTLHDVIVAPIERSMQSIAQLQHNPIHKVKPHEPMLQQSTANAAHHHKTGFAHQGANKSGDHSPANFLGTHSPGHHHHHGASIGGLLERTLEKLTGLLQVGFGEAGSAIIQQCMQRSGDGDLNPLVDGSEMLAVFGFCDIRKFTDTTELLKEEVMMYVNEVASIVHGQVALCDGYPSKNVGDAFLLVWRLPLSREELVQWSHLNWKVQQLSRADEIAIEKDIQEMKADEASAIEAERAAEIVLHRTNVNNALNLAWANEANEAPAAAAAGSETDRESALRSPREPGSARSRRRTSIPHHIVETVDKSLIGFVRVIVEIQLSDALKRFRENPRILEKIPDFKVELGFGLHIGWAIEGPIGSKYKIDASYLSSHVNLSETLEGLTKVYGVPLLLSGDFVLLLSPRFKRMVRLLDIIHVRRSTVQLWTFDIDPSDVDKIPLEEAINSFSTREHTGSNTPSAVHDAAFSARRFQFAALQRSIPPLFFTYSRRGMFYYLSGQWNRALFWLQRASFIYPRDRSIQVIEKYILEHRTAEGKAPDGWDGVRNL